MSRQIVGFLLLLGVAILLVIIVVRLIFGGGSSDQANKPAPIVLASYANTNKQVQLTIRGQVNADETHREIRITVGRDKTDFQVLQGYQGKVIAEHTFTNNTAAYGTFLRAIDLQGFTKGTAENKALDDSRGYCPQGRLYTFEILTGAQPDQSYWSSTCGVGTLQAKANTLLSLFQAQVPDYNRLVTGVRL